MSQPWETDRIINGSTRKNLKKVVTCFAQMAIMTTVIYTSFIILSINKRKQPRSNI